jgi:beta-galactosidase
MVYITSRRAVKRTAADVEVKVYSNQPAARLRVNGVDLGERAVEGRIARWPVRLTPGVNRIEVQAGALADSVEWTLNP